jgi:hypothetical protein
MGLEHKSPLIVFDAVPLIPQRGGVFDENPLQSGFLLVYISVSQEGQPAAWF